MHLSERRTLRLALAGLALLQALTLFGLASQRRDIVFLKSLELAAAEPREPRGRHGRRLAEV